MLIKTMKSAIPAKAWRSFLFQKTDDVLFARLQIIQKVSKKLIDITITICRFVLGTRPRRIRVRAHTRILNGKKVFVKAHWRHI